MTDRIIWFLATFFYVGKIPVAPGTMGSAAGLLLFLAFGGTPRAALALFVVTAGCGFFVAGRAERIAGKKDPREIVIDEVAGILPVFFMAGPLSPVAIALGFLLYRIFDIFKPPPIRRLEAMKGAFGIMGDDIFCGILANLLLRFFCHLGVAR